MNERKAKDVGSFDFPMEISLGDVVRDHELVGKPAEVSDLATKKLGKLTGKEVEITGVLQKHGQVVGFEVEREGSKYYGPRAAFFVERSLIEDVRVDTPHVQNIRGALSEWKSARSFPSQCWDGLESFLFDLAKVAESASISSTGWKDVVPGSLRSADLVLRVTGAIVRCSLSRYGSVTEVRGDVFPCESTDLPVDSSFVGHPDHWTRTLVWMKACSSLLNLHEQEGWASVRLRCNAALRVMSREFVPEISRVYEDVYGEPPALPPLSIGFGFWRLEPSHVGLFEHPTDIMRSGVVSIHHKAAEDAEYLAWVVKHELVHYVLCCRNTEDPHGDEFKQMAELVGIPEKYRG